ncbi:MAG: ABC transporter substrate-binding protein [Candidatus Ozemobacteraceae bacterium]
MTRKTLLNVGLITFTLVFIGCLHGCGSSPSGAIRFGYFANITHAQAHIGRTRGVFDRVATTPIEWKVFNAGPSAMEALLAKELDFAYVGPNPAVNAYLRSGGKSLKILAGACSGGAALVVRKTSGIHSPRDFIGKKIASPEYGNTQDIALRNWLKVQNLTEKEVRVLPMKNSDILTFFWKGELDAAWVPEPWVTRLCREAEGEVFLDESSLWPNGVFATAVLVVRSEFLFGHPAMVEMMQKAHGEITRWINNNASESLIIVQNSMMKLVGATIPTDTLRESFSRMRCVSEPMEESIRVSAKRAWELGFLPGETAPDLSELFYCPISKTMTPTTP